MTNYGAGQFTSAKYFGTAGMESLRAMLRHANHYGLKFIFVYDPYYDPLLVFAGWRKVETYNSGQITPWSTEMRRPPRRTEAKSKQRRTHRSTPTEHEHTDY